ncbi:MAG: ribosome biogenesis GTPase Der [Chloroflexota bacterium]
MPLDGLPIVAVVGRPNVGKSTLFNRVVGTRRAIVEDRARTTRDRLYSAAEWNDRRFVLVDTGGLERRPGDPIEEKVQEQARLAIEEADVILFVVDAHAGETPGDTEASDVLRTAQAPVLVVVNKADNEKRELEGAEFHRLGWEETYPISALHGRGVADLLDALVWALPPESEVELERKRREREADEAAEMEAELAAIGDEAIPLDDEDDEESAEPDEGVEGYIASVAIVGRPNVGKSSLLNALLGEERAIVSDIPGTTRDAIDTQLEWQGVPVRLVDTAGMRRRGKIAAGPDAERYSAIRALRAIGRADVAVLVIDAVEGLTAQDAHVAGYVVDEGVGLVIGINKWDLVEKDDKTFERYAQRLRAELPFLHFAPIVAISAKTGQRVGRVLDEALEIARGRRRRVPTGVLNRVILDAVHRQPAPPVRNVRPRVLYGTQAGIEPPTFVLFASGAANLHFSYQRYLENRLRDAFGFGGTPMRLVFRERDRVRLERKPKSRTPAKAAGSRPTRPATKAAGGGKAASAPKPGGAPKPATGTKAAASTKPGGPAKPAGSTKTAGAAKPGASGKPAASSKTGAPKPKRSGGR